MVSAEQPESPTPEPAPMKTTLSFRRHLRRFNLPTISLLTLLQRTPAVQVVTTAEEFVLASPVGTVLKSAAAVAASLGAMNTLVGATPLVPSVGTDAGVTVNAGVPMAPIAFTVSPTQTPIKSWAVSGVIPPGLDFSGLTAPGSVNIQSIVLSGTPTTAGTSSVSLQAFDGLNKTGFQSAIYTYMITVQAAAATAPTITTQPQNQTVSVGANVVFSVVATGSPAPTYQWRKGTSNLAGETGSSLTLNNVQAAAAGSYAVVVTNSAGSVTSTAATLTVNAIPTGAPSTPAGSGAYGSGPTEVTISWLPPTGGNPVAGYRLERATDNGFSAGLVTIELSTTATSYVDTTVSANTTYYYRLFATNAGGASAPTSAMQVLTPGGTGGGLSSFVNISCRAYCGTGNNVAIGGFVVAGGTQKRVLVRAVGPTLTTQGIGQNEVLQDPKIEVHHGVPVIAENDNWTDNANAAEITTAAAAVGGAALANTDTKSSALLLTLDPGVYSFIARGQGDTSGIVLVEVYDLDAVGSGSTFVNISTRAYSTTGNGVTIGGFVVSGSASKQVLLRAVGPTLTTQGLGEAEVLADPVIELHRGAPVIATNDNWSDNANAASIGTTGARIGALPFATADTKSSALLLTLPPGVYSFLARSKTTTSGIVLVEVYDAD